ncbi:MAG: hypothetical protein Q7S08_02750, partial [bacterium]|nr:hypothetical protein [bacterium]
MQDAESAVMLPDTSSRFGFLHVHRFLFRTGLSIANTFAWIFVFQYFALLTRTIPDALVATLAMYCVGQAVTVLLTPVSAAHLRRGSKHSLVFGALLAGGAYITLGATLYGVIDGEPVGWGIAVFAILLGAYRALYWIPYQLRRAGRSPDFTSGLLTPTEAHGRARLPVVYELLIALMPAFAGITMAVIPYAPLRLLFGSAVLIGMSLVPVLAIREYFERFAWDYKETFRQLFKRSNRRSLSASVSGGLQGTVLFLVWPISVFFIVGSDYKMLGAILSATFIAILLLRYAYRHLATRMKFERSVPVGVAFYVSGWLIRLFVGSPVGVILADSYSHISSPRSSHSIDAPAFEQSADNGS